MPSAITPFRGRQNELLETSHLLTNDKFSDEITMSSAMGDILAGKSSFMKNFDAKKSRTPFKDIPQEQPQFDDFPVITVNDVDKTVILLKKF